MPFIAGLLNPAAYPHPVGGIRLVETHISWVLLTGNYAYKIKKPVNLGFLDFSTLERRRHFCEEEVRLNRRLAPELYLDTVPITGTLKAPRMGGSGPALEYAVRMRQFPEESRLDLVASRDALLPGHVDALARQVAAFHGALPPAPPDSQFGTPDNVAHYARQNFEQVRPRLADAYDLETLSRLEEWTGHEFQARRAAIAARRHDGFVRECHGDLHLGNMALLEDGIAIFDCIEFNPDLRWIDVASEVAFTVMDLEDRGHTHLARRFLNAYLEASGDYAALGVLRFYLVYRAMVRAKVAAIRMEQPGLNGAGHLADLVHCREYLGLALHLTRPRPPLLAITRGVSGSGKTTLTQPIVETLGALRIRSDVERKRLFGLSPEARSGAALGAGIYDAPATRLTYARLAETAESALSAGYPVIVDATFLQSEQRRPFRDLAESQGVPFLILDFVASDQALEHWVRERLAAGTDVSEADLAVLARQRIEAEPLTGDELPFVVTVDAERPDAISPALARIEALSARE